MMFIVDRGKRAPNGMPQPPLQAQIPVSDGRTVALVVGAWSDDKAQAEQSAIETARWLLGGKEAA